MSYSSIDLTPEMVWLVADICERVGALSVTLPKSAKRRKDSLVQCIQASLQIEGNTLGVEQIAALFDGHRVLGPPKDVQEANNVLATYTRMAKWDPCSQEDLLAAHAVLMHILMDWPGDYRSRGVGIQRGNELVYIAPPAKEVTSLMNSLFAYLKTTQDHPLIASCRFHYELESIHPFPDGNGRLGRLWQRLLLTQWRSIFVYIPVESVIRDRRADYYAALQAANNADHSTPFAIFMLTAIRDALTKTTARP
jgi:Fic family protein